MVKYSPQEMLRYPEVKKKQRTIIGNAKKKERKKERKKPMYTIKDQNI
jgi:hypothetical protein